MATLQTHLQNYVTRVATEFKAVRAVIGVLADLTTTAKSSLVAAINELRGNVGTMSALTTTVKTSLVEAINEVKAATASASGINDATVTTSSTYSSSKIETLISQAVTQLINGSPGALDTLNELAAALGNDPNFSSSVLTALAARVRFDAAQTLTAGQKTQVLANIGAVALDAIGDPDTDLVTIFEAALV